MNKTKSSFECFEAIIHSGTFTMKLVTFYRPSLSEKHPVTTSTFLTEVSSYLEQIILSRKLLMIVRDFFLHEDDRDNHDASLFLELLESMNLVQHVTGATHEKGHSLHLVITQ